MAETKTALVTGATRGIGRAIVEALLVRGRNVVAVGRDVSKLQPLTETYRGKIAPLSFDLSDVSRLPMMADDAEKRFGRVDELINAAGIVRYAAVGEIEERDLRAQLEVNFVAPFLLSQILGTRMKQRGRGAIVHIASTLGMVPAERTAAYAATKAALIQSARSFAIELAPEVRVNAIAPGVVDTDMVRVTRAQEISDPEERARAVDAQLAFLTRLHPLQRLGAPDDVAHAVCFILDASWMTGTVLTIDGGLLCR